MDASARGPEVWAAKGFASELFAKIGVGIDWRGSNSCPTGGNALQVSFSNRTPDDERPLAFAASTLDEDSLVVFYDRVGKLDRTIRTQFLAYVLCREITHILQGLPRHSGSGIMKARWDYNDRCEMTRMRLIFRAEDVDLIYRGLEARAHRTSPAAKDRGGVIVMLKSQ